MQTTVDALRSAWGTGLVILKLFWCCWIKKKKGAPGERECFCVGFSCHVCVLSLQPTCTCTHLHAVFINSCSQAGCVHVSPRSSQKLLCYVKSVHLREASLADGTQVYWNFLTRTLIIKVSFCQHVCSSPHFDGSNRLISLLLSAHCCKCVIFNSCFPFSFSFRSVNGQEEVCGVSQWV